MMGCWYPVFEDGLDEKSRTGVHTVQFSFDYEAHQRTQMDALSAKIKDILIGIDQAVADIFFDNHNGLTVSARCGMAMIDYRMGKYSPDGEHGIGESMLLALHEGLDVLEKDHCFLAILGDLERAQNVIKMLDTYAHVARASTGEGKNWLPSPEDDTAPEIPNLVAP